MIRRSLPLSKPAANKVAAAAREASSAKGGHSQLSETLGGVLARFKGTVMEAMAKGIPEQERAFLAQRWGFANVESSEPKASVKTSSPAATAVPAAQSDTPPATDAVSDPNVAQSKNLKSAPAALSAGEETLAKARAAGAAARREMEAAMQRRDGDGRVSVVHTNGIMTSKIVQNGSTTAAVAAGGAAGAHEALAQSGALPLGQQPEQVAKLAKPEEKQTPAPAALEEVALHPPIPTPKARGQTAQVQRQQVAETKEEVEEAVHPILGQLVADLKYKRVYRTSIASLIKVPVWEKQRILRPERALAIAEAKLKKEFNGIPGVITLFEREKTAPAAAKEALSAQAGESRPNQVTKNRGADEHGAAAVLGSDLGSRSSVQLGIVDGQHRVGALMVMAERGGWNSTERNIMVDVFNATSDKDIADLFTEINRAEPVRIVDMPEEEGGSPQKEVLNTVVDSLRADFAAMFKPSARCRPPHVNIDNLRDDVSTIAEPIFQSALCERHGLKTAEDLRSWLLKVNAVLGRREDKQWAEVAIGYKGMSQEATVKALKKAKDNNFFLGMDKSWLQV